MVECNLAKVEVAGPNPVSRSKKYTGQVKYLALILCGFTPITLTPLLTHQNLFHTNIVKSVPCPCLNCAIPFLQFAHLTK